MPVKTRSKKVKKVKKGGAQGFGYGFAGALVPGVQMDAQMRVPYDSCMTVDRPGQQAFSNLGGLPGMKGGAVYGKTTSGGAVYGKTTSGGRYSVDVASPMVPGLAEITKTPCEPSLTHFNPLNKHFTQAGGVGLTGSADSPILSEGTARYTTAPSGWVGGTGAPVLLNQALDQTAWSKACTQTAGRRTMKKRSMKRTMKKSKKTKKSRSRR